MHIPHVSSHAHSVVHAKGESLRNQWGVYNQPNQCAVTNCFLAKTIFPEVINPRRACAARVTVVVLSVSVLCVDAYSGTTGHEAAY